MDQEHHLLFPPFRLDPVNEQLWRQEKQVTLRRKTFEVLRYLVKHPGRLVTKAALLEAVWKEVVVSDSLPAVCVGELRKALGDETRTPRFIETVHGRGYRFIAKVTVAAPEAATQPPSAPSGPAAIIVGRDAEFVRVGSWYAEMLAGRRQVLFVAGEAGIGKTTFVRSFLESIDTENGTRIGRGQCIEQYGSSEPYMPVLEALARVVSGGGRLLELLKKFAPSWVVQLPALFSADDRKQLQSETQGVTQQRMLREIADALEALAAESPLVLVLEDLHWSDFSTIELISAIARRTEAARLMIIGTYRLVEMLGDEHPLRTLKAELELHRQCNELRLKLLSKEDIAQYLTTRFAGDQAWQSSDRVAPVIHARTEGNPLFMVNVVDYLVEQGSLADPVKIDAPHTIQQMIENKLQRLHSEDQRALEAASVAGTEFSATVVAAALERPLREVDDSCTRLARHQQFVGAAGTAAWPDGTVASRFRFHHSLYADVLYHRISASHRVELHRRIAEREEAAYGDQAEEIAAELAHHYTEARLIERAIAYWQRAGRRASERSANTEAISHFRKGLELLNSMPGSVEHSRQELRLQMALGLSFIAVKGYTSPEAGKTYDRALELCRQLNKTPQLFSVLVVLTGFNVIRGDLRTAHELAEQLLRLAENLQASGLLQDAHYMIGTFFLIRGELLQSRKHLEQAITLYDPRQRPVTGFHDSGVESLSEMGGTLWLLGYPDQALKRIRESLTAARQLSLPFILAFALTEAAGFDQVRGEMETTQEQAEELIALSCKEGFTLREGQGVALRGWALAKQGRGEEGIAQIRQGLATIEATGARLYQLRVLGMLAEACKEIRQPQEGLIVLAEAFDLASEIGPSFSEPELYRLKGELLLMQDESNSVQAESCFQLAIEVAQKQSAKSWELRATTSFSRLLARQGRRDKARSMLAEIYSWFTEGFDTADLKEAQTLLKELGGAKNGWFT